MTRLECDYRALKRPFVALLITALAGTALLWSSNAWLSVHRNRLQQSRASLFDAREEYRQAVEAQTIIKTAQQRYMQLEQRGFIGDEPRLLWIEALRDSGRRHHLYTLQYNLKQRQALQLADEDSAHYQVYGSFMQLDIELAHEIDLLRYFTDLERERPAVWRLRGCTLSSTIEGGRIAFDKANVRASCELAWYTVKALSADNEQEEGL